MSKKQIKSQERIVTDVPFPDTRILNHSDIFRSGKPRPEVLLQHFIKEGRVDDEVAMRIIRDAIIIIASEPNLLQLETPIIICGDTHGQFYDMIKLFETGGSVENMPYLFLGDYVDRGCFGVEIVLYLFALKINYPKSIYLLRGNHESRIATTNFTFKRECIIKHNDKIYRAFMESFDVMPLAAILNNKFFCTHGGISPHLIHIDDINKINRFQEPPYKGLMCDLLWADPTDKYGLECSEDTFLKNINRGCSYFYTFKAVCAFLDRNKLLCLIRAHEAQESGFQLYQNNPKTNFPSVITIFSAPNYLDVYNNKAAIIVFTNQGMLMKQFEHSPHPFWLPGFLDALSWSVPYLAEKATEMFTIILKDCRENEIVKSTAIQESTMALSEQHKRETIRNKIKAIGTLGTVLNSIKEGNSLVLPKSTDATELNRESITGFHQAKLLDRENEKLPSRKTRKSLIRASSFSSS